MIEINAELSQMNGMTHLWSVSEHMFCSSVTFTETPTPDRKVYASDIVYTHTSSAHFNWLTHTLLCVRHTDPINRLLWTEIRIQERKPIHWRTFILPWSELLHSCRLWCTPCLVLHISRSGITVEPKLHTQGVVLQDLWHSSVWMCRLNV